LRDLPNQAAEIGAEKPIVISASVHGDHAMITVRDQGIGISDENLDRIFERFERVTARTKNEGLGMGLWITKRIVEAHGGTVMADSELGKGSTFTVRLPLHRE
jgi:signal transduction histidine kinase